MRYDIEGEPKVSIIIPTRDRLDLLKDCIDSIRQHTTYRNYEIIVVDNNSEEQATLDYLKSFGGRVVHHPGEFNFSKIINHGAENADGEYLLLLNNDTEVHHPRLDRGDAGARPAARGRRGRRPPAVPGRQGPARRCDRRPGQRPGRQRRLRELLRHRPVHPQPLGGDRRLHDDPGRGVQGPRGFRGGPGGRLQRRRLLPSGRGTRAF